MGESEPTSHGSDLEARMNAGPHKTMKVPCSFPDCLGFKSIDPTEAMHDEPIFWFCNLHKGTSYMRCGGKGCDKIKIMGEDSGQAFPPKWYCEDHKPEPIVNQTPAGEATIQTADQDKYNEQVSKAFIDLVMLMAFNNWTEEKVRDILIRISSNSYAMGFQDAKDQSSKPREGYLSPTAYHTTRPFTPRTVAVLRHADSIAESNGKAYMDTIHLLLGIFKENESCAAQIIACATVGDEQKIKDMALEWLERI